MRAVILAAGKGIRLEPLTQGRPKHLLPVAGDPLIAHTLRAVKSAGVSDALLIVHYMKEAITSYVGDGSLFSLRVDYADQGEILGTGHALKAAEPFIRDEPFLLVYGDLAFHPEILREMVQPLDRGSGGGASPYAIAGVDVESIKEYGSLKIEDGLLSEIVEKPQSGVGGTINGGIYLLPPEIFRYIDSTPRSSRGEYELTSAINRYIGDGGRIRVVRTGKGRWVDVGRPWDLLEANRMLMDLRDCAVEGDVRDGAHLVGRVCVERGAEILPGSYVEGPAWISSGCRVGPNAYIRPYTYLCRGARVGNACEVKGSIIMEGSHVGHLSYVGDSIVGANCNLGAGTITANLRFDEMPVKVSVKGERVSSGRKKLGAFLGDGVKTGINVSLFPGVKVGSGSWIAPHVALDGDVPPQTFVTCEGTLVRRERK